MLGRRSTIDQQSILIYAALNSVTTKIYKYFPLEIPILTRITLIGHKSYGVFAINGI